VFTVLSGKFKTSEQNHDPCQQPLEGDGREEGCYSSLH
jgi:hypothetical protein